MNISGIEMDPIRILGMGFGRLERLPVNEFVTTMKIL